MKNNAWKRMAVMAMCLLMLVMIVPVQSAEAANVCKQISGSSAATKVFYVKTGSRWNAKKDVVKITQTKGVMNVMQAQYGRQRAYYATAGKSFNDNKPNGTKSMYELYTVKVEKLNQKNKTVKTQNYKLSDGSLKIKLEKNSKYRVTIIPTFIVFRKNMQDKRYYVNHASYNPYHEVKSFAGNLWSLFFSWEDHYNSWKPLGWKKNSTWSVTSTKGITECSFNN